MRPIYKNTEQKEKQNKKTHLLLFLQNKFLWYHVVILTQTDDPTVLFFSRWLTVIPCCTIPGQSSSWQMGCFATCTKICFKAILKQAAIIKT